MKFHLVEKPDAYWFIIDGRLIRRFKKPYSAKLVKAYANGFTIFGLLGHVEFTPLEQSK